LVPMLPEVPLNARRDLRFERLEDVIPEVDRLLSGHQTVGRWTFGQICGHLAMAIAHTNRPAERVVEPDREAKVAQRLFFRGGRFPEGVEVPDPALVPDPATDPAEAAAALKAAIAHFLKAPGPFPAHPRLGPMDRERWERFHCLHCAHHLGFVRPTPDAG